MPEEKEQPKGISRREFAKKIAQGMVAFLVVASVGKGYAATCSGEPDVDCKPDGTEIDENCGSQSANGTNYTFDMDDHCTKKIGTSKHRDKDDACGVGSHWDGTFDLRAHDENCGSTYGVRDEYDVDDNCGSYLMKVGGSTSWTPDFGCSPAPDYDRDDNCDKPWFFGPGTDVDNDGTRELQV